MLEELNAALHQIDEDGQKRKKPGQKAPFESTPV
jgi:hypothetical protein